jgi:hypothetical protein
LRNLFLFSLLAVGLSLSAQVDAPDFLCTRSQAGSEVLSWNNSPSACGPFEATEVHVATTFNGPYTLLAEVTDPNATEYQDPNPGGELRFYFLRHRYNCPGQTVANSDTLDNLIPLTPTLLYVGVEDNDILIEWLASASPEVTGYIILEQTPTANIPIDTVFGVTEFRLPILPGDPDPATRSFLLVAIDPCGNDSPQGRIASPMELTGGGGFGCSERIDLVVDQAAIGQYFPAVALELFVSINGGEFTPVGTFAPNATMVDYRDANDGEDLCFYIEAVLQENNGRARSLEYCQLVSFNQPVRDFPLYGAEVNAAGEVVLQFGTNATQPMNTTVSLRITRGGGQTEVFPLTAFDFASGTLVVPPLADPLDPNDLLRLRVVDDCMREVTTNAVAPIFLSAQSLFLGQNILNWTAFDNELDGDFTYSVVRAFTTDPAAAAGAMYVEVAMNLTATSFTDDVSGQDDIACYIVSVRFSPAGAGPGESSIFRSNIVCVLPKTEVYVPNAFSPVANENGNLTFRPRFSIPPIADGYSLRVFDRWGGLLFETGDPATGWAGDSQGQFLPGGAYVYQLEFLTPAGELVRKAGTINLLR